ncbi:NAD(P)H-quinone oxidoreductase [Polaromonas sp.]|uniref:NAD(P)H-quinone oxidoreductase n=1 Tax=Polaromonas sp. TaxID=1869339 RepID=UPI00352BD088
MRNISTLMEYAEAVPPGDLYGFKISSMPVPAPGPGEVLVRIRAAGVNRADCSQRQGKYVVPFGANAIMGLECAGEVVSRGMGAHRFADGEAVCALLAGGGYAQYVAVSEALCLPIPGDLTMVEGASLMEACCTVWSNLSMRAELKEKDTLLVHGGASGIGVMAIQIYTAYGVRVLATAGSEEKCRACVSLGADECINYQSQDFAAAVNEATGGQGVDVVLDIVGSEYFSKNLQVLKDGGYLVGIAAMSGGRATVDLLEVIMKGLTITGSVLRKQSVEHKVEIVAQVKKHLWPLMQSGTIRAVVHETFDLSNVGSAHRLMESSGHIGKIVLEVN